MEAETVQFDPNALPVRRASVCCHELDGEAVLYDPAHHAVHYLNATAYLIWQHCDGHTKVPALLNKVAAHFADVETDTLIRELEAALDRLVRNGLVDWGQLRAA
ncbi:MAG TPA: HPr-rel-A system PqqD family peptide chaperone [Phycisphaerae bacterium]|nr:HPr-rel-A system PqqD family peptide chaperone [Phycisphaerae bacterium]HOJ76043.1 HPr-rel-A system PqqD family peptide chaperone [Phycisphaerae bacterium]HOM53084.1 HPr-rel-A system PqqD family peptide chaperone [Phycisphaerae bacterium]HON67347.1 HPr-rel-A system PqqD family peptide chaperone [Phycisphaerae bacterium]HOQ86089.1 HPr-rel-A system PqqD family peptide chaperone [Phycisphaerae bacterium]